MDFHKRIRKLRKDLGLSYQAIADACGVKWQTVQQWCKDEAEGGTDPKLANLEPLASILKTTPWYLLFGVEIGVNPSNRDEKHLLSDEADSLIQCIMHVDKQGKPGRETFAYIIGILEIVERLNLKDDSDVVDELAEQEDLLAHHAEPSRVRKHASRKHE